MSGWLTRLMTWPERAPGRLIVCTGGACLALYLTATLAFPRAGGRIIAGDAVHHFVYLRSLVFDHDLRFQNEYIRMYGLSGQEPEADWIYRPSQSGHVRNMMPIGPALVWAPAYAIACGLAWLLSRAGIVSPPDGYATLLQATAGASGVAAATAGAWFSYLAARRVFGARVAIWATWTMWLGSSAIYYSVVSPAYSHASSMLAAGLFVWVWAGQQPDDPTPLRLAGLGALGGFAALVRWQDAVFLAAPALDLARHLVRGRGRAGERIVRVGACGGAMGAAALVAFLPQVLAWVALYGRPFVVPQGGEFMRWGSPNLWDMLVSYKHGLFSWTPLVLVAVCGVAWLARRDARVAAGAALVLLVSWYANAAVADWWAGEAFGARRFVSCFPFFVLGLAAMLDRWRDRPGVLAIAAAVAVGANGLLLFQYQVFMKGWRDIAPYPDTFWTLWGERFVVPFRVAARLLGRP